MENEDKKTEEQPKAVFPSEYEIVLSILDQYQKQLNEATKSTEEALEKLRRNIRSAEDASIGILAQRKLIETLARDIKKMSGKE